MKLVSGSNPLSSAGIVLPKGVIPPSGPGGGFLNAASSVFDGATSKVNFGANFRPARTDLWSTSIWLKVDDPLASAYQFILGNHNTSSQKGLVIGIDKNGTSPRFFFAWVDGSGGLIYMITTSSISAANWYHLALTSDGSTLRFYLNGSAAGSISTSGIGTAQYDSNFQLGIPADGGSSFYPFYSGKANQFALFMGTTLQSTDITTIYNSGHPASLSGYAGLTNWYLTGTNYTDQVGAVNGTVTSVTSSLDTP